MAEPVRLSSNALAVLDSPFEEGTQLIFSQYQDNDMAAVDDIRKVIEVVSKASGIAAAEMAQIVGVDLITGKRLLPSGEQE